jgi:hypothetical protein
MAQGEDPVTRLRNLDLGFLPTFLKGANEGDWGDTSEPTAEPMTDRAARDTDEGVGPRTTGPVVRREARKPSAPEIVFRNLLMNPTVKRDLVREIAVQPSEDVGAVPERASIAGTLGSEQVEALLTRVESLETQLASLMKSTTSQPRRDQTEPEE